MRAKSVFLIILVMSWSSDSAFVNKVRKKIPGRELGNRIPQEEPRNETGRGFFLRGK